MGNDLLMRLDIHYNKKKKKLKKVYLESIKKKLKNLKMKELKQKLFHG